MKKLSVVINTKNAESTLARTLESVKFADEIVVVDMESTDKTVEIAKKYTKLIHTFQDIGYADPARNFALSKATGEWMLVVDADEVVSETLAKKIEELIEKNDTACYFLPRKNIIFSKWIQKTGWWPDYQPRLFQKGTVSWEVGVHRQPDITGVSDYLPAEEEYALLHYNYETIEHFIQKLNTYTTIAARESSETNPDIIKTEKKFGAADVVSTFKSQLLQRLFSQNGIDEGIHGVSLSFLQSFYELATHLKIWEIKGSQETLLDQQETITELRKLQRELNYWIADWNYQRSKGIHKFIWKLRRKLFI